MLKLEVQELGDEIWALALGLGAMTGLDLKILRGRDDYGRDVNCYDQQADCDRLYFPKMYVFIPFHVPFLQCNS